MVKRCRRSQRGQSIIEYLVVAAAVIVGIIAVGALITPAISGPGGIGTAASGRMNAAAGAITNTVTAVRQ